MSKPDLEIKSLRDIATEALRVREGFRPEEAFDTSLEVDAKEPAIQRLMDMAAQLINHEELVKDLEVNLNEAKAFVNKLKSVQLPDLMAECGLSEFVHAETKRKVKIVDFVSGSLPKDPEARQIAVTTLEECGGRDLIKTEIGITFDKKQHNEALSLAAELKNRGIDATVQEGVHASTLQAFAQKCLKKGDKIPFEKIGIYAGRVAKVEEAKRYES